MTGMDVRQSVRRRTLLAAGAAILGATTACVPGSRAPDPSGTPMSSGLLPGGAFLLRNLRIFDGDRIADADSVLVEDGRITAVGRGLSGPEGLETLDADGHTLLPGLIDAHSHAWGVADLDGPRFGVTTMLDMFTTDPSWLPGVSRARRSVAATNRADVWSAGIGVTAPGGWQDNGRIPTLPPGADHGEAGAFVADRVAEGSDYIKVFIEDGSAVSRTYQRLTDRQVREVIDAAHDHGLMAVAHVSTAADAVVAVEAGVDALVHIPHDSHFTADQLKVLVTAGVPVVPTLSVMRRAGCGPRATDFLDDPRVGPFLTAGQRRNIGRGANRACLAGNPDQAVENAAAAHAAGTPVLAGADAPVPGTAHGLSTLVEMMLLVQAGLSPAEALTAATAGPADVFGLSDRGRIAEGLRADLVLINGDPTDDIDTIADIAAVWKNGHPIDRVPAELR